MKARAEGVDLLSAVASAKAGVQATLGSATAAAVLWPSAAAQAEVLDVEGVSEGVTRALASPAGRCVAESVTRSGQPIRLETEALPDESRLLRETLRSNGFGSLAVFPMVGERGVVGFTAVPFPVGEASERADPDGWLLPSRALASIQLAGAIAALRVALARERRRPSQLFEGVMVVDRWDRIILANGLFESLPDWPAPDPFGRALGDLPGGGAIAGLRDSPTHKLLWREHELGEGTPTPVPVALASVRLGAEDGPLEGGRVVFARDLRAGARRGLDGTGRMLALAMRVAHVADVMSHAIRLSSGAASSDRPHARAVEMISRDIVEAGRLVAEALERCLPAEEQATVDVNALLDEVIGRYDAELGWERVQLLTFLRPDLPWVPGDRLALLRAIRILVQDARDSLRPDGGTLTIRTWADDGWIYCAISDDGAGPKRPEAVLGEPLFHAEGPPEMGLDTVREIVERLGGRLLVERRPQVWNRITFMLHQERRRSRREPPDRIPAAGLEPGRREPDGLCVLVVDDNAALRSVLRRYLERRGHAVIEANDGVEGLELVRTQSFDRLIVDIQMPNKDGPDFYRDLDGVDPSMQARTIFVTGGFLTDSVERFIRDSGRPSIKKPFDLAEMARTVEA